MDVLDEIKAILSQAGAWLWAELGNSSNLSRSCSTSRNFFLYKGSKIFTSRNGVFFVGHPTFLSRII